MRPAIHPGEILGDELAETGISATELARQIGVPANRITQIVRASARSPATRRFGWLIGSA